MQKKKKERARERECGISGISLNFRDRTYTILKEICQTLCHMPVIPALGRLRKEDQEFKASKIATPYSPAKQRDICGVITTL
jgi:hypothetical protein